MKITPPWGHGGRRYLKNGPGILTWGPNGAPWGRIGAQWGPIGAQWGPMGAQILYYPHGWGHPLKGYNEKNKMGKEVFWPNSDIKKPTLPFSNFLFPSRC